MHRLGGAVVAIFAVLHLGNHLVALAGVPAHQQALEALRGWYRHPLLEVALLLALAGQVVSGLVLGGFLLIHVAAVAVGRGLLQLDTNFHFAAAGLHTPWVWLFAPYYFLGVAALGVHLGCVAQRHMPPRPSAWRRSLPGLMILVGVVLAGSLVALLAGWLVPVNIPAHYLAHYPV